MEKWHIFTYMKTIKINQMEVNIRYMDPMGILLGLLWTICFFFRHLFFCVLEGKESD